VGGLSFDELAFRPEEIQTLVLQNHSLTIPDAVAEEMARETEGWITGLLLSTQTMWWQGMANRTRVARVSGVGLYDYLAQQVLDQQPPPVRDFLLRTSILEEFDADLCEAVLGPAAYPTGENWQGLISSVLRSNLFVQPVGDEGMWLRYHHLFRDFLQARLAEEQPDEETHILRRLGAVYAERRQWEKAYALYQRLADVESVADLIETAGLSMRRGGQLKTLSEWIDALPAEKLNSRSTLLSLCGIAATNLGETEHGLSLLNQAEALARSRGNSSELAYALVWRAVAYRFLGNYKASLADAEEALAIAEAEESLGDVQAEASYRIGQLYHSIGQ
jgi:LuxR family maltose regulon positive regulatory protein